MACRRFLTNAQNNALWLIQQPYRRLRVDTRGRWCITPPKTGAKRRATPVAMDLAASLLRHGLVEPTALDPARMLGKRTWQISEKGREAYRTGRIS